MKRLMMPLSAITVVTIAGLALLPDSAREKLNSTVKNLVDTRNVIIERHLNWADQECRQAIEQHLQTLDVFFSQAKQRTPKFAAAVVGWGGKWNYIRGNHQTYVNQKFNELVFSPNDLEKAIQQVIEGYLQEVQSIENQMLVRLQADIADEELGCPLATLSGSELQQVYQERLSQLLQSTQTDVRNGIAEDIVNLIVAELLTQVAVKLAVSAGILGTGAASGPTTLCIGIIVGICVDWAISEIMQTEEKLTTRVNQELDNLHLLLINGGNGVVGLRQRLQRLARERDSARWDVVRELSLD